MASNTHLVDEVLEGDGDRGEKDPSVFSRTRNIFTESSSRNTMMASLDPGGRSSISFLKYRVKRQSKIKLETFIFQ